MPSVIVQEVVPALIEEGRYAHPWLGLSGTSLDPDMARATGLETDQRGALVVDVVPDGPADEASLRGSDRKITVDGEERRVGGDVIVAIDGQLEVTLSERPGQEQEAGPPVDETAVGGGAWLGITGMTLAPEVAQAMELPEGQQGVLVREVVSGSPADKAGLRGSYKAVAISGQRLLIGGDVIVAWDGQTVTQLEELRALVGKARTGQEVTLTILRDGEQIQILVTLEARTAS